MNPIARRAALRLLLVPLLAAPAAATVAQERSAVNVDAQGVALKGYDPVAYFTMNKPVRGQASIPAVHEGATYWFATDEHRRAFQEQPGRYLPQYGGFCAFGVAQGARPDIDPNAFAIVDGKLYLNLSPAVQSRWRQDVPGYIKAADENWKSLSRR